ncbi:UNVERIFIED_CONTAM: hypothetical protein FKN15_012997 [Acipenser sinensis]
MEERFLDSLRRGIKTKAGIEVEAALLHGSEDSFMDEYLKSLQENGYGSFTRFKHDGQYKQYLCECSGMPKGK